MNNKVEKIIDEIDQTIEENNVRLKEICEDIIDPQVILIRLDAMTGWNREYFMYTKFLKYLLDDLETAKTVSDYWYMTEDEIEEVFEHNHEDIKKEFYEDKENTFDTWQEYHEELKYWANVHCLDSVFYGLKKEINEFKQSKGENN